MPVKGATHAVLSLDVPNEIVGVEGTVLIVALDTFVQPPGAVTVTV